MNSTPSSAAATVSRTWMAVWPTQPATSVLAVGLDHVATPEIAKAVQDIAHQPGDRGLAGAGIAEEHAVQGRHVSPVAQFRALALGLENIHQFADLVLDAGESDHAVEVGHGLIERAWCPHRRPH